MNADAPIVSKTFQFFNSVKRFWAYDILWVDFFQLRIT